TPRRFDEFGIVGALDDPEIKGLPTFAITGFATLGTTITTASLPIPVTGSSNLPLTKVGQSEVISDILSVARGNHHLKTGVEIRWNILNASATLAGRPSFTFNGVFTQDPQRRPGTGHAFADFLLGLTSSAAVSTRSVSGLRNREYLFFLQDDWKVTHQFTINLGIRYELVTPFGEVNDRQSNFIINRLDPDFGKLVLAGARGDSILDRSFSKLDTNNFAPRVGFAYQFGRSTVLRGGFGIFYGRDEDGAIAGRLTNNPPFFIRIAFPSDQINPRVVLRTGFPPGVLTPENMIDPVVNNYPEDFPFPYVQQWSLNMEHELPASMLLQVGYVGSSSVRLWGAVNINRPPPGPGEIQARRPLQGVGGVSVYSPYIKANYHSLFVKLEKRFSRGLSFLTSYTLGHSIDTAGGGIQNIRDLNAERASSNNDIRHRLVGSYIHDLPFGPGRTFLNQGGILATILSNWRWTGIASLHSGTPFTPTLSTDPTNSGASARPDRLSDGNLPAEERTLERYFDVSAFQAPTGYRFGNSGRNILRGPGLVNFDFGFHRDFRIREELRVEFRAEFFNAFNTPHFDEPFAVIGTARAGRIESVRAPERQIQFGLKVLF
ncbi:MAG: TonB-dependent receptor, partial [Acidobacteria bacterium]|nr:TonB-dependent receptor [Acidobacteriota bacterium]